MIYSKEKQLFFIGSDFGALVVYPEKSKKGPSQCTSTGITTIYSFLCLHFKDAQAHASYSTVIPDIASSLTEIFIRSTNPEFRSNVTNILPVSGDYNLTLL